MWSYDARVPNGIAFPPVAARIGADPMDEGEGPEEAPKGAADPLPRTGRGSAPFPVTGDPRTTPAIMSPVSSRGPD